MTTFTIIANGTDMGIFIASTREECISAYVADAGYSSVEEAAEVLSQTVEQFLAELTVSEA